MSPRLAFRSEPSAAEHVAEPLLGTGSGRGRLRRRAAALVERTWQSWPPAARLYGTAVLGTVLAAGVAATTAKNPLAAPAGAAVELRVATIVTLVAAGLFAQTSKLQARMGGLLIGTGFLSVPWLLNGSSNRVLFSIGVICSSWMPVAFAYLMLAHPTGRLFSRLEARFLWLTGGVLATLWLLGVLMTSQPPVRMPLVQCAPHCPPNVFSLGSAADAVGVVKAAIGIAALSLTVGTPILLLRRARVSTAPVRRSLIPVLVVAGLTSFLSAAYTASVIAELGSAETLGALSIISAVAVPVAILAGLVRERLFMGQTLAEFVNELVRLPQADPEALMAAALRDPSLKIAYRRPAPGTYVDSHGAPVSEFPADKAVAWIERGGRRVAAVLYSPDLSRDERFVQAAGAAALIRLETTQLEADVKASSADLAASRVRLMEMAHAERRRLERDLHDGVQQHLVGLRIKLEMAAHSLKDDPARGERVLTSVGREMDDILHEVRSLARGIYPSLLTERGLSEALRAAARNSPIAVEVRGRVRRYSEDVEVAVYFCCLEALQNVAKHAGPDATATVSLSEDTRQLSFEVRDSGVGFNPETVLSGSGLVNMRDRADAVGGTIEVTARWGRGTSVYGSVPV